MLKITAEPQYNPTANTNEMGKVQAVPPNLQTANSKIGKVQAVPQFFSQLLALASLIHDYYYYNNYDDNDPDRVQSHHLTYFLGPPTN